jgi:type I restriction enzyme S subunit
MSSELPAGWTIFPLGREATIVMGNSPRGDTYNGIGKGTPLLNGPTEFGPRHPVPIAWTVAPTRYALAGDILFCVRGSTTGRMNRADQTYCIGRGIAAIRGATRYDTDYIFAAIAVGLPRLLAQVTGSTFPSLSTRQLNEFMIPWPPVPERRAISAVVRTLDDKIDSNHWLAGLLEQIAQAEFQARFVDFVGVGNLEDSNLGRIPRGWQFGTLADLADLHKDQVRPAEAPDSLFEHFSIPAFDTGNGPSIEQGRVILSAKTTVPGPECVLVSKLNPNTKRVWWPQPDGADAAICSPEFLVLVPRTNIPTSYLYAVISSDDRFYRELLSHVTGTTGSRQRVKPTAAMGCRVILPTVKALDRWDALSRPLYDHAHSLIAESRRLREVRDMLLPKLISGAIRVPATADPDNVVAPLMDAAK